ncbi:hypothetical protein F4809DRAFT_655045 [Biscogniauxia mediterranea]|nr:hypothetical protein F4809DRAFT_655045 [Biscogniauxia mediterranea]
MATTGSNVAGENSNGHTGNGNDSSGYHPLPYPYTALTKTGVPLLDTQELATPLANTLLNISQNTKPAVEDALHAMNAYNASTASRIERGVWAYFHPAVTELPTEDQVSKASGVPLSLLALLALGEDDNDNEAGPSTVANRPTVGREGRGRPWFRRALIPDWTPEELVFPAAIAQDLARDWGQWLPLDTHPDRVGGAHARYRVLVFVHRSRPDVIPESSRPADAETVYTMTAWDREAGTLTHYDFRSDEGWGARLAAARLFWLRARARFDHWGPRQGDLPIPNLAMAGPDWGSLFVANPPVFGVLANLLRYSPRLFPPSTTLYAVLGGCIVLANSCASAQRPLSIPDDFNTATGLGPELLPALYERLFLLLRAQDRVSLGPPSRVVGTAGDYDGDDNMFHSMHWLNKHLAITRPASLFRQRIYDRLAAHVPYEIDHATVLLFQKELVSLAMVSGPPAARR